LLYAVIGDLVIDEVAIDLLLNLKTSALPVLSSWLHPRHLVLPEKNLFVSVIDAATVIVLQTCLEDTASALGAQRGGTFDMAESGK
jgi:hypothetical protein